MEFSLPISTPNQVFRKQMSVRRFCLSLAAGIMLAACVAAPPQVEAGPAPTGAAPTAAVEMAPKAKPSAMAPIPSSWTEDKTSFPNHPTWTFMPSSAMPNGKHALMVVLHGCNQTHNQLKQFGNLENVATKRGIVLAIPDVGSHHFGNDIQRCWDYDMATDHNHHIVDVISIAETLAGNNGNNIDRNHIYVVGLSAGAGMALDVACKRPDLFAGVGAIAGPSVGSSQFIAALGPPLPLPFFNNIDDATTVCMNLATTTGTSSQFATQIASIAVGDMDRDSPNALYPFVPIPQIDCAHAGQIAFVSARWSPDNVEVLRRIYGTGALGGAKSVQGGLATKRAAMKGGKERISFVMIKNVGHAWPAGTGSATCNSTNDPNGQDAGFWIAQKGLDYPEFITDWLMTNNVR